MVLAGIFAVVLCLGLILGDWLYFIRLTPDASRYGCGIARSRDQFTPDRLARLLERLAAHRDLLDRIACLAVPAPPKA